MGCSEKFSIFGPGITQVWPFRTTDVAQVAATMRERNHPWQYKTDEYHRMISQGAEKKVLEAYKRTQFCYATFSGVFTKRDSQCLVAHSGLICLDFDHVEGLEEKFRAICEDKRLEARLVFHSPSGDGIKAVVPMPADARLQERCFRGYSKYCYKEFGLRIDESGKDVGRACFLPWDINANVNVNLNLPLA